MSETPNHFNIEGKHFNTPIIQPRDLKPGGAPAVIPNKDPLLVPPREKKIQVQASRNQMSGLARECRVINTSETYYRKAEPVIELDKHGNPTKVGETQILQFTTPNQEVCGETYTIPKGGGIWPLMQHLSAAFPDRDMTKMVQDTAYKNGYLITEDLKLYTEDSDGNIQYIQPEAKLIIPDFDQAY